MILIKGPTGVGKSINAYYVAVELQKKENYTVIPARQSVDIINYHVPGTKQIFIIDDVIGKYAVNETNKILWGENESLMKMMLINNSQTKLILTTRTYVWSVEGHSDLTIPFQTCDFLSDDLKLLLPERLDICKSYINESDTKTLNEEAIMMYSCFPTLCAMYSSSTKLPVEHFFTVPCQMFEDEINNFKTKSQVRFMALAFLAIRQMIAKNSLTIDNHEHDKLLQDLFHESSFLQCPSKHLLMSTLAAFKGEYVKEISSCFKLSHGTMQDIVLCCIANTFMISVIKYCKTEVILNRVCLESIKQEHDVLTIRVKREEENAYFERLVSVLSQGLHKEVFESTHNSYPKFRKKFIQYIRQYHPRENFAKTPDGMTVLHVVSGLGYDDYVSFFLRDKQLINIKDNAGNIPLHLACKSANLKIVEYLIKNKSLIDIANVEEMKPFFYVCEHGFITAAKYLLHHSAKWIKVNEKYRTKNKRSVLHVVCKNGYTSLAVLLLDNNAEVDVKDADGCTPLHLACHKGNSGTVTALLNYKANVNSIDSFGKTSVYLACSQNHKKVLQLLLDRKAVVNQKTNIGMTPLSISCKNENIDIVNMLLQSGAKVSSHKPGISPLQEACKTGNERLTNILIQSKVSVNHKTKDGITPLHEACMNGHVNITRILLDNKANINETNKYGWTALFFGCSKGFCPMVDLLLQHGANVNICDEDKVSPLMAACKENCTDVVNLLLHSKANVNHCDNDNCSSLLFACKTGNVDLVNLLLTNGADMNLVDRDMTTPLHTACKYHHTKVVLVLIEHKANLNVRDNLGQTPLFKSIFNGYIDIVDILLKHGASVDICDNSGKSPLSIAEIKGHTSIIDVLRQYRPINQIV